MMKYYIIGGLVLFAAGLGTGFYLMPTKTVIKTNTVTQTNDIIHDHIITVTHTVTKPDGSKDTTTTVQNNTVVNDHSNTQTQTSSVTTYSKPQWKVSALAGLSTSNLTAPIYGAHVEKRILGPIFAGAWGNNNREGGISLGLEF